MRFDYDTAKYIEKHLPWHNTMVYNNCITSRCKACDDNIRIYNIANLLQCVKHGFQIADHTDNRCNYIRKRKYVYSNTGNNVLIAKNRKTYVAYTTQHPTRFRYYKKEQFETLSDNDLLQIVKKDLGLNI